MRFALKLALLPVLLAAAAAWFAAPAVGAAAPPADVSGSFQGKLVAKVTPLSTEGTSGGGNYAELSLSQEGSALAGELTVVTTDRGTLVFGLSGAIGGGRFWLAGSSENGEMTLTGIAKGSTPKVKIKGTGLLVNGEEFITFKYAVKQVVLQ